jgi:membrane protease YdiL (CAAX protease family)
LIAILLWTLLGIVAYAFSYTYVWNRTRSVAVCMVLHATYNTANGVLLLMPHSQQEEASTYVAISLCLTGTLLVTMLALVVATKGRLGLPPSDTAAASQGVSLRRRAIVAPS